MNFSRFAIDYLILTAPLLLLLPFFSPIWRKLFVARHWLIQALIGCVVFVLLWLSTKADLVAIVLGIAAPFMLLARLTLNAQSWKVKALLRGQAVLIALLLLPSVLERGESTLAALLTHLIMATVPGRAVAAAEPRIFTALVLTLPVVVLAVPLPAPEYLFAWLRYREVTDMFIGGGQIAALLLLGWLVVFGITKLFRHRKPTLAVTITTAAMLLLFTKFEPFGWTAMILSGVSGFLWFRHGPVPTLLVRHSILATTVYTILFPLLAGWLEYRFEYPGAPFGVMALVNALASVPLGAFTALMYREQQVAKEVTSGSPALA
ncbi:MAG TPA: hypothetical protein VMU84_08900 [Thermoanaerobaculia bacterium]|nr:hypothetical protein [Thermoanaerobaculia bacterium]